MTNRLIFSDESTFHISGKVNRYNSRIWGTEKPSTVIEHERDSVKVNVFCAISSCKLHGPFFFSERSVTSNVDLDMFDVWLIPQLDFDSTDYIFQQDGAPPHWSTEIHTLLNQHLPKRWTGRSGDADDVFCFWPPRSPDLTPCDFFLWGYVKDRSHSVIKLGTHEKERLNHLPQQLVCIPLILVEKLDKSFTDVPTLVLRQGSKSQNPSYPRSSSPTRGISSLISSLDARNVGRSFVFPLPSHRDPKLESTAYGVLDFEFFGIAPLPIHLLQIS
ncbi:hypothetical protein AVEN_135280-1 [Araneus ventricosus]|uniref:Tc1-like transposase DDE domain-containing protein n=1 Tax=Araneus ventricosus TaxID=182803 RepID=A0A4Y2CPS5_ARAVE|nr:hypothetical protein AVEN_135280-1 [Araneus ventricosus]